MALSSNNFVGREKEQEQVTGLLNKPDGSKRVAYFEGVGGIGKTKLIQKILEENRTSKTDKVPRIIDFYSTDNRSIDGVRETIIQYLEEQAKDSFSEYHQKQKNTHRTFRKCLQELVKVKPVLLVFDTFELVHNDPLALWLFDDSEDGLQMPGLVCLIGSRPPENDNQARIENLIKDTPLVQRIALSGLSYDNAVEFYCKETGEDVNKLNEESKNFVKWLVERTEGNPLLIELVIDQSKRDDSGDRSLLDRFRNTANIEVLKQVIMNDIKVKIAKTGLLEVKNIYHLNIAEYDTLLGMSYLTRRMDETILQAIVNLGFVRLGEEGKSLQEITDTLSRLFFVKSHPGEILTVQLHDEMARMVRQYLFPDFGDDISGERRREFQQFIPKLYDELIQVEQRQGKNEPEPKTKRAFRAKIAQLQVERMYYLLEYGRTLQQELKSTEGLEQAYDYFVELKNTYDEQLFKLLPGEMLRVIGDFSKERQRDIYTGLAEIQQRLNNLTQAELYWNEAKNRSDVPEEQVDILLKIHNMVWPRDPERSLNEILPQAREIAEKQVFSKSPDVLYEIGFTYSKLQELDEAIKHYRQAFQSYNELKLDRRDRLATILNDLGFALARIGQYEEGQELVTRGREIRQELYEQARSSVDELSGLQKGLDLESKAMTELEIAKREAEADLDRAEFRLGMTHSTEGQIARYNDELVTALGHYDDALRLLRAAGRTNQIALIQNRRGETFRRMARQQHEKGDKEKRNEFARRGHEAIDESLYLKEKYNLELTDMMERRKGRLLHDQAIWAIQETRFDDARELLEKAGEQFRLAITSARNADNWLEILESEAEVLFLQDDWAELRGKEYDPASVQEALGRFQKVLSEARLRGERIYQFEVYDCLYAIENGAYHHEVAQQYGDKKEYDLALDEYVKGYLGMATSPGYGHAQFRLHLSHLRQHIQDIDDSTIAIEWCRRFLDEFQQIADTENSSGLAKEHEGLIGWLFKHMHQRSGAI